MTEAVLATFSEVKILKTRSVMQIVCEIPIEQADEALKALGGIPQPSEERWVGVALAPKERGDIFKERFPNGAIPQETPFLNKMKQEHRPFSSLPLSQQAGIRCEDEQFHDFLIEHGYTHGVHSSNAQYVREYCNVSSRSELDTNDIAAAKWRKLEEDYQAYRTDLAYAGSLK